MSNRSTWFHVLIFLFMLAEYGSPKTESLKRSVYTKLMKKYTLTISKDITTILDDIQNKNRCAICNKQDNNLFSQPIIKDLEKFEINYALSVCSVCKNEITTDNMMEYILSDVKIYRKIKKEILYVCIKNQYLLIKFTENLSLDVPENIQQILNKIDVESHLDNLQKYKINELSFFMYRQLEAFHYLKTEPHMWEDCQIIGEELDEFGNMHPKYTLSGYLEKTPFNDRLSEYGLGVSRYEFDDNLDLNHEHLKNCQLCGTEILLNFRIKCDLFNWEMVIGSECILKYNYLKGDEYARSGVQKISDYIQSLFRSGIGELQKEVHNFFEQHEDLLSEITQDYKKNIKFNDLVEKLSEKSHKNTVKKLIERAKILNIDVNREFDTLIDDYIEMIRIKKSNQ